MTRRHARSPHPSTVLLVGVLVLIGGLAALFVTPLGRVDGDDAMPVVSVSVPESDGDASTASGAASAEPDAGVANAGNPQSAVASGGASGTDDSADAGDSAADPTADAMSLDAALDVVLPTVSGNLSVAVLDTTTGRAGTAEAARTYVSASIAKVDILATLLLQAQAQGRTLTAAEQADAVAMIEQSDNDAADALWHAVGEASALRAANAELGLVETEPAAESWGLTTTTVADQLRLLQAVTSDTSPLDAQSRAYLLDLMDSVAADQAWGVSAADDSDGTALKNGWLPRTATGLWVINSIGRVSHDGHELLVAVLSDGQASKDAGVSQVETAAKAAADAIVAAIG